MQLSAPQVRVLAALIEKEAAVPDSYPLTLNALRSACNQATNRRPVVSYDDRTIETALMGLKSIGLVRFIHPSHGGRTIRYRHAAAERWHLSPGELLALSALALRGAQTTNEVRARIERLLPAGEDTDGAVDVEDLLDALAARSPDPLAARLERRPGERDQRWIATIGDTGGSASDDDSADELIDSTADLPRTRRGDGPDLASAAVPAPEPADVDADAGAGTVDVDIPTVEDFWALVERVEQLGAVIGAVATRVERLERDLGVDRDV